MISRIQLLLIITIPPLFCGKTLEQTLWFLKTMEDSVTLTITNSLFKTLKILNLLNTVNMYLGMLTLVFRLIFMKTFNYKKLELSNIRLVFGLSISHRFISTQAPQQF